jgi:subtilisin
MKVLALVLGFILVSQPVLAKRYILESANLDQLKDAAAKHNVGLLRKMEVIPAFVSDLSASQLKNLKAEVSDLSATEDIELRNSPVHSNSVHASATIQPSQSTPWGLNAIKAPQAWSFSRGAGVKVCIVDTGIDKTHPDLQANIVGGRNYVVMKGRVDASSWNDDNGHGSHVAGTVAALDNGIGSKGVAPLAKLYAVKVLNQRGSGYLSDVADGVSECVRAGAQVINMSLGATSDPNLSSPLKTAVLNAITAGVVVVVAAGNEGEDIKTKVPAGYPQTIAVAAVDQNMNYPYWSNFGLDTDDFTAPGVGIYSTWKSGGYNTISGTSMASPHVAGIVALRISSGSLGLKANTLGKSISTEGAGLINALETVQNQ